MFHWEHPKLNLPLIPTITATGQIPKVDTRRCILICQLSKKCSIHFIQFIKISLAFCCVPSNIGCFFLNFLFDFAAN